MLAHHPGQQSGEQHGAHNHPGRVGARIAGIEVPQAVAEFSPASWATPFTRPSMLSSSTTCQRKFVEIHTSGRTIDAA